MSKPPASKHKKSSAPAPRMYGAIVKVTSRCNLHCRYCYMDQKRSDLPLEILKKFFLESVPLGLNKVYFHGGEPLLMPLEYYQEAVGFLKKNFPGKKIELSVMTNGTLISRKIIRGFRELGISFGVSIDGPKEVHNQNRGKWEETMRGIRLLKKEGIEPAVICVVTKESVKLIHPQRMLDFFVKNKLFNLSFTPCELGGKNFNHETMLSPEEYFKFMKGIFDEWIMINDEHLEIREIESIVAALMAGKHGKPCLFAGGKACIYQALLSSDGGIFLCDWFMEKKFEGGNLKNKTLAVALVESKNKFNKIVYKKFKKFKLDECSKCKWFLFCNGGCSLSVYNNTMFFCHSFKPFIEHISNRLFLMGYRQRGLETLKVKKKGGEKSV